MIRFSLPQQCGLAQAGWEVQHDQPVVSELCGRVPVVKEHGAYSAGLYAHGRQASHEHRAWLTALQRILR